MHFEVEIALLRVQREITFELSINLSKTVKVNMLKLEN